MTSHNQNNLIVFLCSAVYILFLSYYLSNENYLPLVLPVIIAVGVLSIFNFKSTFYSVVFLTPISISLLDLGFNNYAIGMAFPTEPLLFGLMILVIFKMARDFKSFESILKHRITTCIIIYLFWMFITCITSSMPLVSFKMFLTRLWYILPIFVMGCLLFRDKKNIFYFILSYAVSLVGVVIYTTFRHASHFFDKESAHYVMSPFFNDHTSYGALIAFFIPLLVAAFFSKKNSRIMQLFLIFSIIILVTGLVLSYTRAAWISLFVAIIIISILKFKIRRRIILSFSIFGILSVLLFQDVILNNLEKNRQDSSDNLIEHVTSLSNISTDASNMERINRWKCAFKMFVEKPVFGWGPGTYQFQYASFQLHRDKTIISSNRGDMGNAHSEYFGPLAESGLFGFLLFTFLVLVVISRAITMYYTSEDKEKSRWILAIITSLLSYFIHGLFNNFLDTDKASVAIWGAIAIIVSLDVFNKKKQLS